MENGLKKFSIFDKEANRKKLCIVSYMKLKEHKRVPFFPYIISYFVGSGKFVTENFSICIQILK